MMYFRGWVSTPIEKFVPAVTDKAICLTIAGGYTDANDRCEWFPKSQIRIGEPNEAGNAEILIPMWIMRNKHIDGSSIREINSGNGEDNIVER